jgi:hypothetical protein
MIHDILNWPWWMWFVIGYSLGAVCMGWFTNALLRDSQAQTEAIRQELLNYKKDWDMMQKAANLMSRVGTTE